MQKTFYPSIFGSPLKDPFGGLDLLLDSRLFTPNQHFGLAHNVKQVDGKTHITLFTPNLDHESLTVNYNDSTLFVSLTDNGVSHSMSFNLKGLDVSTLEASFDDPVVRITAEMVEKDSVSGMVEIKGLPQKEVEETPAVTEGS